MASKRSEEKSKEKSSNTTTALAKRWYQLFKTTDALLLTSPTSPDGDSIGAQLALKELIVQHFPKKRVFLYHENPVASRFSVLKGADAFFHKNTSAKIPFSEIEDCIVLDGGHERIGDFVLSKLPASTHFYQIDHHAVDGGFPYELRWFDSRASSTGELVYRLLATPPFSIKKLNPVMASALYVSLIADTGFFRHDSTTPETLRMAAHLYETGIRFSDLAEQCLLLSRFEAKKLLAIALQNVELHADGKATVTSLSHKELNQVRAQEDDKEGIIDEIFLVRGVDVGALLLEVKASLTKVSLRSRTSFDVAAFAKSLAARGGGHKKAAGCTMELPLIEAKKKLIADLTEALKRHTS